MKKRPKLPKLPYGQGSMSFRQDGTIMYRKRIGEPKKERTVYGETPKEVMEKMSALEDKLKDEQKKLQKEKDIKETATLYESMQEWLEIYKKPRLKKTSYDTLKKTVKSRIGEFMIGDIRLNEINSEIIQKHINELNTKEKLSYSTIKKCYDALNDFFRHKYLNKKIQDNPMLTVEMINKENIIKDTKEIQFFESDDIKKFIEEAISLFDWAKKPKHQYGLCLAANIYLGMRGGELIALKWKDVDFDNNTIWVHDNLQLVSNEKYDENNKEEMARLGVPKQVYETQSLKNYQNRHIHMNKRAKEFLELQYHYSEFTKPNDYVCCTRDGKHSAISYLSDNIGAIEIASNTKIRERGTHVIRHTCASLYFRAGVRIELIASLLGHSVDVCRKTYIHFVEEQMKEAVKLINDYDSINKDEEDKESIN